MLGFVFAVCLHIPVDIYVYMCVQILLLTYYSDSVHHQVKVIKSTFHTSLYTGHTACITAIVSIHTLFYIQILFHKLTLYNVLL